MEQDDSVLKFEQYLKRRFPERRTAQDYLSDIRQFRASCAKAWREISMHDVDDFVDQQRQKGMKATTINRRVAALKSFFDFLAEESGDLGWPNPVRFKRHASRRGRQLPRDLSNESVAQLWQVICEPRDRAWFALMLRAGLRVGEVVSLRQQDLLTPPSPGHAARLCVEGKGRKERIVLLSSDAYAVLQEWLQVRPSSELPLLFLNERGQGLSVSGIEWLLKNYGQQAGVKVTPHQLRHTYARQLTEARMPVTSLSKLLGHAQVTTTQLYTAGADPALHEAYQEAMQKVATLPDTSSPLDESPSVVSPWPPAPADALYVAPPAPAPLPDWDAWGMGLPSEIRDDSLAYVQQLALAWKARARRQRTQGVLSELKLFWEWLLAQRTIHSPGEITLEDLRHYQSAMLATGRKNSAINRRLDYVMGILRRRADRDLPVHPSVFRLRILPRPESLPRHLSQAECQRLETLLTSWLDNPDPLLRLQTACLFVLLHTGIRSGECCDLLVQDVDLQSRRLFIHQGKGARDRVVYLSERAARALQLYWLARPLAPTSPLWVLPNGKVMSQDWLQHQTKAIGLQAAIPDLQPHRLRHTFATRLLNAGMDVTRIQKLLGHDLLSTTMIYARLHDATVEQDYRNAMQVIELRDMPLSHTPLVDPGLFAYAANAYHQLDNSV